MQGVFFSKVIVWVLFLLVISGCNKSSNRDNKTLFEPEPTTYYQNTDVAVDKVEEVESLVLVPVTWFRLDGEISYQISSLDTEFTRDIPSSGYLFALIETDVGTLTCRLYENLVPRTVDNFVGLARGLKPWRDPLTGGVTTREYYTGAVFHRVIPNSFIQTGDPTGTGWGGPGFSMPDEFHHLLSHTSGSLSMSNSGPHTGSGQIFFTLSDASHLDQTHTVFGRCVELETLILISNSPCDSNQKPLKTIKIKRITFKRSDTEI